MNDTTRAARKAQRAAKLAAVEKFCLDRQGIAARYDVSPKTIDRWRRLRDPIPTVAKSGDPLFPVQACDAWMMRDGRLQSKAVRAERPTQKPRKSARGQDRLDLSAFGAV